MPKQRLDKDSRWNFRVGDADDGLVRAASSHSGETLSAFVSAAAPAWAEFNELLDREPRVPDGLRELFSKPSAFE